MQIKLLKDVVGEIAGKQAVEIVNLLAGKKNVNEFLIAKKLKLTINQTRNILYKLSANNLVSFTRKKDKKKGWYIYFWTLNMGKSLELLRKIINREIDNARNQLKSRRTKRFYVCRSCNIEVSEETALLNDFECKECGQVYELSESEKVISEISSKLKRLVREKEIIEKELQEINEKEMKRRKRRDAREKKERAKKRAAKRKAKKKEKEKEMKKAKKAKKPKKKAKKKKIKKPKKAKKKAKKSKKPKKKAKKRKKR